MKSSRVIYFLLIGAIIASIALFFVFYETETFDEKEVVVPLVKKVVEIKLIIAGFMKKPIAELLVNILKQNHQKQPKICRQT